MKRKTNHLDIEVSLYNVEIDNYSDGKMIEYRIELGRDPLIAHEQAVQGRFLDNFHIKSIFNGYDYGPIKNRFSSEIYYLHSNSNLKIFKQCSPYINILINRVRSHYGFSFHLGSNDIVQENIIHEDFGTSLTTNLSFGLLFKKFDIS